jgi:hypothetical protein
LIEIKSSSEKSAAVCEERRETVPAAEEICRGDEEDGKPNTETRLLLCCFLIFNYLIVIFKL